MRARFANLLRRKPGGPTDLQSHQHGDRVDPTVGHSLTEIALSGPEPGDYVEFISESLWPGGQPWLSTTWWLDGSFEGIPGFVQVSRTIHPGMRLAAGSTASYAIEQAANRWNYYYDGQLVGYFPDALWHGVFTSVTHVQVFGEVETAATTPAAEMGDGQFAEEAGAATVNGYQLFGSATSAAFTVAYETETTPWYYDVEPVTATSFRFGGPGAS